MTCGAERHAPYPIEQLARSAHTQFQIGFAKMTMRLMPAFDDVALEPTAEGRVHTGCQRDGADRARTRRT